MWNTPYGERTLKGYELRLIASECGSLADAISETAKFGGSSVEVVLFSGLAWQQQMLLLERVFKALIDPTIPAPTNTALLEATVAAIYAQMVISVQTEIDLIEPEDDPSNSYDVFSGYYVRQQILNAIQECTEFSGGEEPPLEEFSLTVECDEIEEWEILIDSLRDRILADEDWKMESIVMDLAPSDGQKIKQLMGIQGDYFVDIPPEATDEEAEEARLRIIAIGERIRKEPLLDNDAPF